MFFKLAVKSLLNRKASVLLTISAMSVSIFVLLAVEHIRQQSKESFSNTVSGVDLIVGARTGQLNLLLYSVFHIGAPTNNISWATYKEISEFKQVAWSIPIALGDSHKGYRVIGTSSDFFKHFSYGNKHTLDFEQGQAFSELYDVVIGSQLAQQLNYKIGSKLVLAHGMAKTSFSLHENSPFTVVGILKATGTPVDQSLYTSLEGIETIHANWQQAPTTQQNTKTELQAQSITAFMLGLKSRLAVFKTQRAINEYNKEALSAILPGATLMQLWQVMSLLEGSLRLISALVFIAAALGLSAMLMASIRDRKQEIYLLRIMGAAPSFIFLLIELEALLICAVSIIIGAGLLSLGLSIGQGSITAQLGLSISNNIISINNLYLLLAISSVALISAALPSLNAYRVASKY
ncbi:ABC transporter permease [Agaribacterium sp. ZY112]|uniref:ABC transporter permease n=1 Tax=Agaribacterium sp. ZY112 TaxID=3233574 RepID=UPI0035246EB7